MTVPAPHTPPAHRRWNLALWIAQWLLGISLVGAGVFKLSLGSAGAAEIFPWSTDVPLLFTITSVIDVLGGLGLVLPAVTRIMPRLTVLAALGVVLLMASSVVFYLSRGEASEIAPNIVMAVVAAVIAWGRWRIAPITGQLADPPRFTGGLPQATPPADMAIYQLPTGTYMTRAAFAVRGGAFGDQRHFAATSVLIRHPQGDLLIDAGFGAAATEHIDMLPSFRRSPHELGNTVSEQLDAAGYDRTLLRGVLLTHSHWDHVSGLDSLATPIWMTADERRYASASKDDGVFTAVTKDHEIREYGFDGPAYLGFASSHDFYGDGSVVIVPAAGHTTGSVIVFVTLPSGERFAFIGDLTWQRDGISRRLERPLMLRMLADSDAAQIRRDLLRVIALDGRMQIVPSHDVASYTGIPLLTAQGVSTR